MSGIDWERTDDGWLGVCGEVRISVSQALNGQWWVMCYIRDHLVDVLRARDAAQGRVMGVARVAHLIEVEDGDDAANCR